MSPQPASVHTLHLARTTAVIGTVVVLVLGVVVLGQRVLAGGQAGTGDASAPPQLTLSSFLGGIDWDEATDVEVDAEGNRYLTGFTTSDDFPQTLAAGPGGIIDAFVAKVDADGALAWTLVLGGTRLDTGQGLALDDAGNVYVTGRTESPDFPTTAGVLQPALNGTACTGAPCHDAFVTKLDPAGGVVYSTYLGGTLNEEALAIAVDAEGSAHVSGNTDSRDLPTVAAFQPEFGSPPCPGDLPCELDVFVSKLTPAGDALTYSTYLGGNGSDRNTGIALADDGTAYVAGTSRSVDFPTQSAFQAQLNGVACGPPPGTPCPDAFVTAFAPDGSAVYSTLLGGTEPETGGGVAVDAEGRAVVTGSTQSPDFPTARPVQAALDNESCTTDQPEELCADGFVTRLSPDGSALDFSTYLGGAAEDQGLGVAVDDVGTVVVAGRTDSRDFPVADAVQPTLGGYIDGFVTALSGEDGSLAWSTFLGGSEADRANAVTVDDGGAVATVGRTLSPDFPVVDPFQPELQDEDYDAFLSVLD